MRKGKLTVFFSHINFSAPFYIMATPYQAAQQRVGMPRWSTLSVDEKRALVEFETDARMRAERAATAVRMEDSRRSRQRPQSSSTTTPFQLAKLKVGEGRWRAMSTEEKRRAVAGELDLDSFEPAALATQDSRGGGGGGGRPAAAAATAAAAAAAQPLEGEDLTEQLGGIATEVARMQAELERMQGSAMPQLEQLREELNSFASGYPGAIAEAQQQSQLRQRRTTPTQQQQSASKQSKQHSSTAAQIPAHRQPRPPAWGMPPVNAERASMLRSELRIEEKIAGVKLKETKKSNTYWAVAIAVVMLVVLRLVVLPLVFHGREHMMEQLRVVAAAITGRGRGGGGGGGDGEDREYDAYLDQPYGDDAYEEVGGYY